jgi:hypothetical protein
MQSEYIVCNIVSAHSNELGLAEPGRATQAPEAPQAPHTRELKAFPPSAARRLAAGNGPWMT